MNDYTTGEWNGILPTAADSSLNMKKAGSSFRNELALLDLEKAGRLPEFSIGYFNQSLRGIPLPGRVAAYSDRFQVLNLGIQLPVFPSAFRARIKSAETRVLATRSSLEAVRMEDAVMLQELNTALKMETARLEFLSAQSLAAASEVYEASLSQWKAGNGSIQEVMLNRKALLQVREEMLQVSHYVALYGIRIQHLTSGKW
jgi:cobalt-zinc-cadmium resistance protein CzcA